MFKIIEGDFKNNKYSNEEYLDNWPMLYILENGKKAYIGESNHVKTRITLHTLIVLISSLIRLHPSSCPAVHSFF